MTRSHVIGAFGALLMVVLFSGCSLMDIRTSHDPTARFQRFKQYGWIELSDAEEKGSRSSDAALDRHIRSAVDRALRSQGFKEMGADGADFLVDYRLDVRPGVEVMRIDEQDADASGVLLYSHLPDSHPGHQKVIWGVGAPKSYSRRFSQRSLNIEMVEPVTTNVLWRGSADAEIQEKRSRELQLEQIDEAVRKILRDFPPKPPK